MSKFMEPVEAYMLASVAMDLRISEVVDVPNWIVTAFFPLDIVVNDEVREKLRRFGSLSKGL